MDNKYAKILYLPHKQSEKRKHMPIRDRAAQFAPFAALTGYNEAVTEVARFTEEKIQLDQYTKNKINDKLIFLSENIDTRQEAVIVYFVHDKKKQGGAYVTKVGTIKKIQVFERKVILEDGTIIPIDDIFEVTVLDGRCDDIF